MSIAEKYNSHIFWMIMKATYPTCKIFLLHVDMALHNYLKSMGIIFLD